MEYRSPVRLVAHAAEAINPYTPQAISRTRKKVLAEIALSDDEITLDGVTYTRNDVMSLLDGITDDRVWQHHCTVYAHEPLLKFLEAEQFDGEGMKAADNLLYSPYFVAFVSPYFSYAFNNISNALLKDEDWASLDRLLDYQSFILPEHSIDAYQRIRIYLDDLVHTLKNLGWEKFRENELILGFVFDSHWIVFMNKLPSSFDVARDEVVSQVLTVVERFQRKATWYYLDQVCIRLQQVHCGPTTHAEVNRFQGIMHQNAMVESKRGKVSTSSGNSDSTSNWGRGIFWAIWIVVAIIRWSNGCNRSSTDYHYTSNITSIENSELYQYVQSSQNERNFKHFLGELNRETHEGEKQPMKNASTPFPTFSTLPLSDGQVKLELKNETAGDLLFFYFVDNNRLVDEDSKPYAVYVKKGGSFTFYVKPEFGHFNMVFGKDWTLVKKPFLFDLKKNRLDASSAREAEQQTTAGTWRIYNYFGTPALSQPFLFSDLTITNMEQNSLRGIGASTPTLIYAPPDANQPDKRVKLRVQEKDGYFSINASGTLYVYKGSEDK